MVATVGRPPREGIYSIGVEPRQIPDPGNGGAIARVQSGYVLIVTAGAETRTLAAPLFIGQRLLLIMQTDGGDAVLTVSAAVNATGNNTLTFNDAGDNIELVGSISGTTLRWTIAFNDGVSLSTV